MEWQDKAMALNVLAEISIKVRKQNDWYISQATEIGGDGFLTGSYGNGKTPEEAIENHWAKLVGKLPQTKYIVTRDHNNKQKWWRWNCFMWKELPQPPVEVETI